MKRFFLGLLTAGLLTIAPGCSTEGQDEVLEDNPEENEAQMNDYQKQMEQQMGGGKK